MLKRIFIIALITGASQLFIVFALKFISQHSTNDQLKSIAQIDSLVSLIMSVIALGLQSSAIRNLATKNDWKEEYRKTQSARISMGLIITVFALFAFWNKYYIVFLIAPLLACSGDYALYGRGFPVNGAIISFIRSVIPFCLLILLSWYQPGWMAWGYLAALSVIFIITNIIISKTLDTPYIFYPGLKNLHLYITSLPLGIVVLSFYFFGLGLVLVSSYFYSPPVITIAYIGLKFYVIFKGILRIIHQAFVKEMVSDAVCLKIDQLSSLIGLTFLTFIAVFPKTFISFFFGVVYTKETPFFLLIALSAFIFSLFYSITTKALLDKKDRKYAQIATVATLVALVCPVIFSAWYDTATVISLSLLIGECIFVFSALYFLSNKTYLKERIMFYAKNLVLIMIPLVFRIFISDSMLPFLFSAFLFLLILGIAYFKKFNKLS